MLGNVITQGISVATGLQRKFSWTGVAVGGVVGGVAGALDAHFEGTAAARSFEAYAQQALTGAAAAIAGGATRSLLTGSDFGDNILAALPDVIGSTIGNAVAGGIAGPKATLNGKDGTKVAEENLSSGSRMSSAEAAYASGFRPASLLNQVQYADGGEGAWVSLARKAAKLLPFLDADGNGKVELLTDAKAGWQKLASKAEASLPDIVVMARRAASNLGRTLGEMRIVRAITTGGNAASRRYGGMVSVARDFAIANMQGRHGAYNRPEYQRTMARLDAAGSAIKGFASDALMIIGSADPAPSSVDMTGVRGDAVGRMGNRGVSVLKGAYHAFAEANQAGSDMRSGIIHGDLDIYSRGATNAFLIAGETVAGAKAARLVGGAGAVGIEGQIAAEGLAVNEARGGVYLLRDPAADGAVVRSGRTIDLTRREADHLRDPALKDFEFDLIYRTDLYNEQRGLEQILHDTYQPPLNKIRPISPNNKNYDTYMESARKYLRNG